LGFAQHCRPTSGVGLGLGIVVEHAAECHGGKDGFRLLGRLLFRRESDRKDQFWVAAEMMLFCVCEYAVRNNRRVGVYIPYMSMLNDVYTSGEQVRVELAALDGFVVVGEEMPPAKRTDHPTSPQWR
jgi:hypothetical protein